MAEKRQHRRLRRRMMVKFGEKDFSQSGFTWDVSPTGLFIVASQLPALDARLHLQLFVDPERFLLFEGEVRRHKRVPPELRSLERGGFGVRLLSPRELITTALGQQVPRYELSYSSREAFQHVYQQQLSRGAVFVSTSRLQPRDTEVKVDMVLAFSGQVLELEAVVIQVYPPQEGSAAPTGLALAFKDRAKADVLLRAELG
jgi:hypothetical protein